MSRKSSRTNARRQQIGIATAPAAATSYTQVSAGFAAATSAAAATGTNAT